MTDFLSRFFFLSVIVPVCLVGKLKSTAATFLTKSNFSRPLVGHDILGHLARHGLLQKRLGRALVQRRRGRDLLFLLLQHQRWEIPVPSLHLLRSHYRGKSGLCGRFLLVSTPGQIRKFKLFILVQNSIDLRTNYSHLFKMIIRFIS